MKTGLALAHLRTRREKCIGKLADLFLRLIEQMKGQTLRGSWADSWQTFELIDQPG